MNSDWFDCVRGGNAFEGPYRRTRPLTVTRWMRLKRWVMHVLYGGVV